MKYVVTINRAEPWAKDVSVSTRGHEPAINSHRVRRAAGLDGWIDSAVGVYEFMLEYAPEVTASQKFQTETGYFVFGKDRRGYSTSVQVRIHE